MAQSSNTRRNRSITAVCVVALLLAGGAFVRMSQLQKQAKVAGIPRVIENTASDMTAQQKNQSIERARFLRTKWEPWARQHQAELTKMLNANLGDKAALNVAWNAVPGSPERAGLQAADLCPQDETPPIPTGFSWNAISKIPISNPRLSSEVQKTMAQGQSQTSSLLRHEFEQKRDFIIATSLTSRTEIHLWVSGRITETGRVPATRKKEMLDRAKAEGRSFTADDMRTPHQQIEPPYDFLLSKQPSVTQE